MPGEVTCWKETSFLWWNTVFIKCESEGVVIWCVSVRVICIEQLWSDWCPPSSSWLCPPGLQYVHFSEGLRGAAVLHPEEAVLAERPALWGPPLPRHRRLALLPGQQDRTCGLEEASGELVCAVTEFQLIKADRYLWFEAADSWWCHKTSKIYTVIQYGG